MENNLISITPDDGASTTEDNIYVPKEERVTVSRSKLEHLKYMADDDRLQVYCVK